ncbi:MAG TPA: hypothetical protein VFN67_16105 [Polyangiales bacterium]|jgi:hypothetical protein|nr:hypothetical protein [Polyangiales bacterium]
MSQQGAQSEPAAGPQLAAAALEDEATFAAALRPRSPASFQYTRWLFLRALGFIYVIAFAILCDQGQALIGSNGLLPASGYLERIKRIVGFAEHPTLFWFDASDGMLRGAALLGLGLSLLMLLGFISRTPTFHYLCAARKT